MKDKLAKIFFLGCVILFPIATMIFAFLTEEKSDVFFVLAITFGTCAFHFDMRYLMGLLARKIVREKAKKQMISYHELKGEAKLYKILKVRKWRTLLPTYSPENFQNKSPTELYYAVCEAELSHFCYFLLSYLPIFVSLFVGELPIFLLTSLLSSFLELPFLFVQRYHKKLLYHIINKEHL